VDPPELIEAAVRIGDEATAQRAYERLAERSSLSTTPWARGIEARSRALLSDGPAAERDYVEAIEQLGRSQVVVHHARAELIYGEWLRREHRRMEARLQLRSAYSALDAMGAAGFAERARRELEATGDSVRGRTAGARDALTHMKFGCCFTDRNHLSRERIAERRQGIELVHGLLVGGHQALLSNGREDLFHLIRTRTGLADV